MRFNAHNCILPYITEPQDPDQSNPSSSVPKPEQCGWGPHYPICKNAEEDWDGEHQKHFQQTTCKQIHSRNILPKTKIQGKPRHKTLSAPKTTGYHITSTPEHHPLICQTDMQNRYI